MRAEPRPGRPGSQGARALECAAAILAEPGSVLWTLPRLKAEIARRDEATISVSRPSRLLRQKGASPGAALATPSKPVRIGARQDRGAVERAGVRLELLRQQAQAGDIHLLFADESEALTHPYLAHLWAKRGADLRIEAPGQAKRRALLGAFDHATKRLLVETSGTKRSGDLVGLLRRLDQAYAPRPGAAAKPVILVLDNGLPRTRSGGSIHTSKLTTTALAPRPWLVVEWLPKHAPELNAIERCWRDLKRHHLASRTFADAVDRDHAIHHAVTAMSHDRPKHLSANLCTAA